MAGIRADIDLSVNTQGVKRSLDKATNEINKVVNKVSGKPINFNVNQKSFTQPLGRINSSANEFTKSLEASNARVIAFGASVAILDGISNSFKGLVREAVKFEKTLADINVVLNLSNAQLRQFGEGLFDTARKTAQGFNVASEAALEFSRQGLSTEEVLRRTNDALILTRLTSLKAADAVAGLTAAVNAFGDAGLTTTDIIDKLAAVDVKFAVSSEDLINALQRAGAVAIDAGVEFDSLIGLVAALQQTTARGGAVIGNSLKTIFTRIQRPESLRQLEEMGIAIRDISGAVLPADRILLNMSKTFDRLTQAQQSNVVQFSAGIFQANVFRAALRDLAKEQSLQVQATQVAANAAGEAAMKNELLNKTVSALASQAGTNIQELGAILGQLALGPQLADALEFVNKRIEEIRGALGSGEDEGSTFAKGLVRGIGNVISGPAAIAFGAIFIKLFVNIAKFASNSMKDVLGVVSQKDKIKQMEESIVEALSRNQHIQQSLNNLGDDRLAQEKFLLGIIEQQTAAIREQRSLAAALAGPLVKKGVSPNLVSSGGLIPEGSKKAERQGAARGGYTAGAIDSMNVAGIGDVVYNKAEKVKQFPGMKQPAIMPPQDSKAGSVYQQAFQEKHGFNPYANGGFIPNFATLVGKKLVMDKAKLSLFGGSMDIARATGVNYKEIEKLFASGQPLKMSASLKDIIMSSDSGKQKISGKETLFEAFSALSGAGVHSIERMFNVRPPVPGRRGQGKLTQDQFAERKALNLLNKERGGHQLTYDPKTKKGVQNYPVDIIGPGAHEVKSGKLSAANLISKSLRMASDRELSDWMAANKISGGKGLQGKNLKEAQRLAGKLGIKGSNKGGEFSESDADMWNMSEGLVPNFGARPKDWKAIYKEFVRKKHLIKERSDFGLIGLTNTGGMFPVNKSRNRINSSAKDQLKEKYDEMWRFFHSLKSQKGKSNIKYDYKKIFHDLKNGVYKSKPEFDDFFGSRDFANSTANPNQSTGATVKRILGDKKYNEYVNLLKALPGGGGKRGGKGMPAQYVRGDAFEKLISEQAFNRPFVKGPQAIDIENIDPSYFNKRNKELFDIDGVYLHGDPIFTSNPKGHGAEGIFKKLANSIETKKQINNRIMDITSRPGRRPSTIDFGAFPFADMIGNSSRRGIEFVSESIRPVDISGRLPEMLGRIDPYTNIKFSYMRDYLKVPDKQRQILYGLKRGSEVPSSRELGEGLSYDGLIPNFRYWKKYVQFAKGMDGGWGIKGDTTYLEDFIDYLEKDGGNSPREIDKLRSQLSQVKSKKREEVKSLGYASMGREGAKYYSNKSAIYDRKEVLSLKGIFLKNLKDKIHQYNDIENSGLRSGGLVPNFANIVPFKKKTIKSKNLMHQEYLKAYAEGQDKFRPGQTMLQFLSQFYDRKTLQDLRKYPEDYRILSGGFVPNFANPLRDAIEREKAAGIPASNIRVEQSNQLKGPGNPMGLAVTNTRDEPAGVGQGIRRAKSMGLDPKSHGAAGGFMPNFVSGAGIQSTNFNSFNRAIKESTNITQEKTEADRQAKETTNQRSDADAGSLQKLFFMQSAISMANGFLQQFAEDGGEVTKSLSSVGMAASNAASTFIALKEFGSMMSTSTSKFGKGVGKVLSKMGPYGAALMGANELLKEFAGISIFDIFKNDADKAADSLKKLAESAEKTQSALDEANNLSATRDKMSKLEILGSRMTLKQDKELISLRIKEIKQQNTLRDRLSKLDTAHIKNKSLIESVNKVRTGEISGLEEVTKVLQELSKQEALKASFGTITKTLNKNIEDLDTLSTKVGGKNIMSKEFREVLNNAAAGFASTFRSMNPEDREFAKKELAAGRFRSISGLQGITDLGNEVPNRYFVKSLQKRIKISEKAAKSEEEAQAQQVGLGDEYIKIIAAYKKQRENVIHQNQLSEIANATQRKINSSLIDLQSEYQMISNSASIEAKATLERAAIQEEFTSSNLKAQEEALKSLDGIVEKNINIEKLTADYAGKMGDAREKVEKLKDAIVKNINEASMVEIAKGLGGRTEKSLSEISTMFQGFKEAIQSGKESQEVINTLLTKMLKSQDAVVVSSAIMALIQNGIIAKELGIDENLAKILDNLKRSLQTNQATLEASKKGLESETALNLIKQKTVEGARKLAMLFAEQKNPAETMIKNLQGEVDTLAVINHFRKDSLKKIMENGVLDQKAYETQVEKNRTDAEAALLSLKQLQVQENILRDTDEFKIIQVAKMQSEVLGASAAAKDAAFRNEYLSYNQTRESLVQSQISEETTTLETTARNNLTKLKLLAGSEQLKKQVDLQIQEEITSAQSSALINSEKALILSAMGEQGRLLQQANQLQESSNKLIELQNAIRKAAISKEELRLSVGADLDIERLGAKRSTRESAMRATLTGSPEDVLAFAQSLKETNKLLGEGSRAFDTLRVKIAEMDVAAKNLGSDLVDIGLDQTRNGMKQLFKDIGSGAKSAKEAWSDFGLGLADVLLDRMMEHNIDQIIKNLTFAFTGENALSEADKIAGSNNHLIDANNKLITSLDALARQVEGQQRALAEAVAARANVGATVTDKYPGSINLKSTDAARQAAYQASVKDPNLERLKRAAESTPNKEEEIRLAKEAEIEAHKAAINQKRIAEEERKRSSKLAEQALLVQEAKLAIDQGNASLKQIISVANQFGNQTHANIPSFVPGYEHRSGGSNTSNNFFGGKIQKFAKGGFVEGEPGVDKVPAMLTAGEFVVPKKAAKALKDGGMLSYFEEGGVAERVKAAGTGLAQTFAMQEAARYVARKMQDKDAHKDKPPEFDMNKFKNLNLNSTVSIARGDPRSSGKLLAKDPIMEDYRQHLLDVASYRAAQKNKKVSERMSRIGSIVGTVASFAVSQLTALAAKPLNAIIEKGKNVALGHSGIGKHSEAFKAARKAGIDVDYKDVAKSIESGSPLEYKGRLYGSDFASNREGNKASNFMFRLKGGQKSGSWFTIPKGTTVNTDMYKGATADDLMHKVNTTTMGKMEMWSNPTRPGTGIDRGKPLQVFSGGEIPAMLTAGESFIPAPIARRIGYDNLNKMNRTGSLPIIQGPGGIDNVGPVGLNEGDFIIRRSSTDKLLRENPNMMRFAMQNPDGFRKAEQGYYQGGIVGTTSSIIPSVSAGQKTSGAKSAPVVENRISSLLEGTRANQKETVATNQNTEVTNNINVNVTIDKSGNEKVSTEGAQGTYEQEQQLAMKIKTKVLEVIREEKRIGGELSG